MARMQEKGRYAFSIIEPDIQLAGYYGFTNAYDDVQFMIGGVLDTGHSDAAAGSGGTGACRVSSAVAAAISRWIS